MLLGTFIRILTSLIRDFCTSDRNFASTFFQIPPHDGHPWSWLVVGHCDYNPHNRLSLSRYMPCPAYLKIESQTTFYFIILSNSSIKESNNSIASSIGFGLAISTPAIRNNSTGDFVHPPFKKDKYASISACVP